MRGLAAVGLALAASLAFSTPALGDDASLKAAGVSHDAQFKRLGRATRRAQRTFRRTHSIKPLIKVFRAVRREIKAVGTAVKAQEPSSPNGAEYKTRLLESLRRLRTAIRYDELAVRAARAGRKRSARRWLARAGREHKLARASEKLALKALPG